MEVALDSLADDPTKEQENFIRLLLSGKRMGIFPEIRDIFESLRKADSGVTTAEVHTPYELSDDETKQLKLRFRKIWRQLPFEGLNIPRLDWWCND